MNHTKILLSLATIAILSSGCTEDQEKTAKPTAEKIQETKTVAVVQKVEEAKTVKKVEEAKTVAVVQKVEEIKKKIVEKSLDISLVYQKCSACHGQNAEKKALNKSAIIKDWDASKIAAALKGYKNGTYGGAMKGLMVAQVGKMDDKKIELLSQHIADFK